MNYAKLIDGDLILAPNPILHDGKYIGNPPGEVYLAEGYLPVIYTDPTQTEPGYVAVYGWYDEGDAIRQVWTIVPEPITEDEALVRYANELTGAEDETLTEATETLIKQLKEGN